jgi:hypothetical protein
MATALAGASLLGLGLVAASATPASATSPTELFVTASGAKAGPCSISKPCSSVSRAVVVADHQPFNFTPVVVNVGRGHFVTSLNFPDMSYPEPMLTIRGISPSATTLVGNGSSAVLFALADAPKITVEDLTITGANAPVHDGGNFMNFTDVTFSHNVPGGALFDDGGTMAVSGSTFSDNALTTTTSGGGAISDVGGSLTIVGSLLTGNSVKGARTASGGAVYVNDGHLSVTGSTITRNAATGSAGGGAIGIDQSGRTTVIGSTINANRAAGPGGLVSATAGATISFGADILVANTGSGGSVCSGGGDRDLGYNVIDQSTCSMGAKSKLTTGTAVGLVALASNGGPTHSERIRKSSAAHDVIPVAARLAGTSFCSRQDQRGVPRRQGPATSCDAGSYQFAPPVIMGISPVKGPPGTEVRIKGYGFDFLALRFGSVAPGLVVSGEQTASTMVPKLGKGMATIALSNPDGHTSTIFDVLPLKTT